MTNEFTNAVKMLKHFEDVLNKILSDANDFARLDKLNNIRERIAACNDAFSDAISFLNKSDLIHAKEQLEAAFELLNNILREYYHKNSGVKSQADHVYNDISMISQYVLDLIQSINHKLKTNKARSVQQPSSSL